MPQLTLEQALNLALSHHNARRLPEAESIYRQIVAQEPGHAPTLRLLGVLAHETARPDEAIELLRLSVEADPATADGFVTLGTVLAMYGRMDEAAESLRQALALRADDPETMVNLANVLQQQNQLDEAIQLYRRATAICPDLPEAHFNLGRALAQSHRTARAAEAYQRALQFRPDYVAAREALCNVLNHMGAAMAGHDRHAEAIAALKRAVELCPNHPDALNNLGNVLLDADRLDEAVDAYRQAIAIRPDHPETWSNFGTTIHRMGPFAEAEAAYRRALALAPGHAAARFNLGWNLLLRGNYTEGFPAHEARLDPAVNPAAGRFSPCPLWTGSAADNVSGFRILLTAEQGFGDTIQFVRYAPLLAERGAWVTLQTQPQLRRLLSGLPDITQFLTTDEPVPREWFDAHCPLMSLAARFHTTLDTIPANVPYLSADPALAEQWRERLADEVSSSFQNVGLVWSGNAKPRNRSIPAPVLEPLGQVAGVRFHALQKPDAANPASPAPDSLLVTDWSTQLANFAETAALIANLDLVITIDTAVAHLAGAMGKSVWILLQFVPDWRWLLGRADSPWYPTARLYRQPARGDWDSVIRSVAEDLRSFSPT